LHSSFTPSFSVCRLELLVDEIRQETKGIWPFFFAEMNDGDFVVAKVNRDLAEGVGTDRSAFPKG
jgi:hypothetical protein